MTLALALIAAAVGIGAVHSLAPDHWLPFGALARGAWVDRDGDVLAGGLVATVATAALVLGL